MKKTFPISNLIALSLLFFPIATMGQQSLPSEFLLYVHKILSRNPDISISEQSLNFIRAQNISSRLFFLPSLSLTGSYPINNNNFLTNPKSISISSKWNLFKWGADYHGFMAAISHEESQLSAINATVITTEKNAITALISEIQQVKEVDIYNEMVKNQTELLDIANQRYQRGYLPLQEVQKLMIDLENAKASLANSKMHEIQTRAHVENLLGQPFPIQQWPWLEDFKKGKGTSILQKELRLSQRPDWNSAEKEVQSQTNRLNQNQRLLLPSLDAQFSYGYYSGFFGSFTGSVGVVSLTFPLFDQLTNYSNAKAQSYLKATSEIKLEKLARDAKAQWQSSHSNFQTALETALTREETLKLSKKLYEDNFRRFQLGRITANDLAIDRTRMNSAELFTIQGWAAVHIYFADLCHSLGYRVSSCISTEYAPGGT